jgi:hypothetical protein
MSQFAQAYTAATDEAVATIGDEITYRERVYPCVIGEETYGNTLGEGGFEAAREVSVTLAKSNAPTFRMGDRCKVNGRSYRIVGIDTDLAAIDLRLQSPDAR